MWAMGSLFSRRILLDEDWPETGIENENLVLESCSETGRSSTLTSRVPLQPMSPASPVIASLSKMSLNATLDHYTQYQRSELCECVKALGNNLPAIREKYSQHKYKFVAKKYCPPSIPSEFFQNLSK